MSITSKLALWLGVVLLAAVVALGVYSNILSSRLEAAHEDNMEYSGDANSHKTYARGLKVVVAEEKEANERMDEALEANRAWSDEPVPSDVARLLCHGTDAACRVPASDSDH